MRIKEPKVLEFWMTYNSLDFTMEWNIKTVAIPGFHFDAYVSQAAR